MLVSSLNLFLLNSLKSASQTHKKLMQPANDHNVLKCRKCISVRCSVKSRLNKAAWALILECTSKMVDKAKWQIQACPLLGIVLALLTGK